MERLIVCLTGMPGAGKSTIARALAGRGFATVSMGDAVRAEAARRGIEPTAASLGGLMLELRRAGGPAAVAALVEGEIDRAPPGAVIVDGIRSNAEIDCLRAHGRVRILAVHAAAPRRLGLLRARARSDDPDDRAGLDERDGREMGVGMSDSIALADETISNNDIGVDELVGSAHAAISRWMAE